MDPLYTMRNVKHRYNPCLYQSNIKDSEALKELFSIMMRFTNIFRFFFKYMEWQIKSTSKPVNSAEIIPLGTAISRGFPRWRFNHIGSFRGYSGSSFFSVRNKAWDTNGFYFQSIFFPDTKYVVKSSFVHSVLSHV